jgi:hypothetical protein
MLHSSISVTFTIHYFSDVTNKNRVYIKINLKNSGYLKAVKYDFYLQKSKIYTIFVTSDKIHTSIGKTYGYQFIFCYQHSIIYYFNRHGVSRF